MGMQSKITAISQGAPQLLPIERIAVERDSANTNPSFRVFALRP